MTPISLRAWLRHLHQTDRLAVIDREVALRFELAAVAKRLDGRRAALFRHVRGHRIPVAAGLTSQRSWLAEACGVDAAGLTDRISQAAARPRPCDPIPAAGAPVRRHTVTDGIDLAAMVPAPVHHELDAGRYITAGLCIVRDPDTRRHNVSIHRLQLVGPDRLTALILPRHTHLLQRRAEQRGRALECAIVIGADPVTILASQADVPFGVDELEVASALHDAPLQVTRAATVDVDVPAHAEIVVEGRILPGVREPEGPFGEFPRYYGPRSDKEVIEVTAVTWRERPIYHTIVPAAREHLLLGAVPREAGLLDRLRRRFPGVRAVHLTPGGTFRYHLAIALEKHVEGQARNVIMAALGDTFDLKHVVVVDADVDVFDAEEVEWAIATRFQGDRDLVVVSGAQASSLDPSSVDDRGTKLGFDCTVPLDAEPERYRRVAIPGLDDIRLEDYVAGQASVELD